MIQSRVPQGNVFNYGKAIQDGQSIANNALSIREKSRQAQGQAASNALSQQGMAGQAKYAQLSQQGFGDIAKAEQSRDVERDKAKGAYAKSQLEKVNSAETFEAMARHLDQVGAIPYQDTMKQFGAYNQENIDKFLGRTKKSESSANTPKWMRVAELSRVIDSGKATEGDQAEFEALTKPSISLNIPSATQNVTRIADATMDVLKGADDESIKGEIENEDAYRAAISTKALAIQAKAKKGGDDLGLEEAMRQAHDGMIEDGSLVDAKGVEIFGFTPFSKKWVYDPKKSTIGKDKTKSQEAQPSDLKEGETGVFNGFEFKRENGILQRRKVR